MTPATVFITSPKVSRNEQSARPAAGPAASPAACPGRSRGSMPKTDPRCKWRWPGRRSLDQSGRIPLGLKRRKYRRRGGGGGQFGAVAGEIDLKPCRGVQRRQGAPDRVFTMAAAHVGNGKFHLRPRLVTLSGKIGVRMRKVKARQRGGRLPERPPDRGCPFGPKETALAARARGVELGQSLGSAGYPLTEGQRWRAAPQERRR